MLLVEKTIQFDKWLRKLKDRKAKAKILIRIQRIEEKENFGDSQPVGEGVSEMRIHYATGYRVYYKRTSQKIVLLLIGGDKSTQKKDIEKARQIWADISD